MRDDLRHGALISFNFLNVIGYDCAVWLIILAFLLELTLINQINQILKCLGRISFH